jgi:predicted lipoprotein with Yx(FWY)xxD motif
MSRALALAALLLSVVLSACGSGEDEQRNQSPGGDGIVEVRQTSLGPVLVDGAGRTLYLFERDEAGESACDGDCARTWPPAAAVDGRPASGSPGVQRSKLGVETRSEGIGQISYDGHPLYRYSGDEKAGDTNGQGKDDFGGKWYAVSPAGDPVNPIGSGGGY